MFKKSNFFSIYHTHHHYLYDLFMIYLFMIKKKKIGGWYHFHETSQVLSGLELEQTVSQRVAATHSDQCRR
jgi:hypothetical protein